MKRTRIYWKRKNVKLGYSKVHLTLNGQETLCGYQYMALAAHLAFDAEALTCKQCKAMAKKLPVADKLAIAC